MYLLFIFLCLIANHARVHRSSARLFVRSLVCSLDHLTRTSAANFFSSLDQFAFLLLLAVVAAAVVVPGEYVIHLGSMIDWISMSWFKEPFEQQQKKTDANYMHALV